MADSINKLATGKVWLGYEALNVGLIDRIITSDEYIGERLLEGARVLRLVKYRKPRFLFPSPHPSRVNVWHPIDMIRNSVRAVVDEIARVVHKQSGNVEGVSLGAGTDSRLVTSLSSSIQPTAESGKVC